MKHIKEILKIIFRPKTPIGIIARLIPLIVVNIISLTASTPIKLFIERHRLENIGFWKDASLTAIEFVFVTGSWFVFIVEILLLNLLVWMWYKDNIISKPQSDKELRIKQNGEIHFKNWENQDELIIVLKILYLNKK